MMPDPVPMARATGLALLAAGLVFALINHRAASNQPRSRLAWISAIASGSTIGIWLLGLAPHWPPLEDRDRLLLVLLPLALLTELLNCIVSHRASWIGRAGVIALSGSILLHQSSYLADLNGPGSHEWPHLVALLILGGIAACELVCLLSFDRLASRAPGAANPIALAITILAASLTIMLSGYATGGLLGLPLAAALLGSAITASLLAPRQPLDTPLFLAIVGLGALLTIGRFFGQLSMLHTCGLGLAPLLGWLPQIITPLQSHPRLRGTIHVFLVSLANLAIVASAAWYFTQASQSHLSAPGNEPSLKDYTNFAK